MIIKLAKCAKFKSIFLSSCQPVKMNSNLHCFLLVDMTIGEARMLRQNLFYPIVLYYSWLGVVCTDCLLPATRLQMKVTAMLLLCQVLHALCHCTQCGSDMRIFFCKYIHISIIFICLLDLKN